MKEVQGKRGERVEKMMSNGKLIFNLWAFFFIFGCNQYFKGVIRKILILYNGLFKKILGTRFKKKG